MRTSLWFLLCVCLLAVPAQAQQTVAVSYDLNVYTSGATVPSTRVVQASVVTCDLATRPADTPENATNPTTWWWEDAVHAGAFCRADDAVRLLALPVGTYIGGVVAVDAAGVRASESARYSFTKTAPLPPAGPRAVTGVRISK